MLRKLVFIAIFLLLSCSLAYADFGDTATIGEQDSSGNYRWRVTSDGDLIPGTTAQNDIGTTSKAVAEVHLTTLYKTSGYVIQGIIAANSESSAASQTLSLAYGYFAKTTGHSTGVDNMIVPDGTYAGQTITIAIASDGGIGTVTPTTKTGFTRVNLDAATDNVTLRWVSASVGWIILGQVGATTD